MKKIILLMIVTVFGSCNNKPLNDYELNGLNEEVKNYSEIELKINKREKSTNDTISVTNIIFNQNGKLKTQIRQSSNNKGFSFNLEYIYDLKGNVIKQKLKKDSITYEIKYYYKGNRITKKTILNTNDSVFDNDNAKYIYNKKDRLIKIEKLLITLDSITKDTIFIDSREIIFNPNGLKTDYYSTIIRGKSKNKFQSHLTYDYNDKYLVKKIKQFNEKGDLKYTRDFKYIFDDRGNWIEKQEFQNGDFKRIIKRIINYK
jgi:hypothetical protein